MKSLRRVVYELGLDLTAKDVQDILSCADLDKDGLLSEEEFYAIVTKRTYS